MECCLDSVKSALYHPCLARFFVFVFYVVLLGNISCTIVLCTISVHCLRLLSAFRCRDEGMVRPGVMLFHLGGIINPSRDACQHQQLIPESEFLPPALLPVMG